MTHKLKQESANEQCFANSAKSCKESRADEAALEAYPREEDWDETNIFKRIGFVVGFQQAMAEMKKDAIEGMVNSELGSAITINNKGTVLTERFNLGNLHIGDKVKVVIIKK